jgi:hypothetical protein
MQAYRVRGWISAGLGDGRLLQLRPFDYVPPSFVASSAYVVADWLSSGTIELVDNASSGRLAQADLAAAPQSGVPRTSSTIDGFGIPGNERQDNPYGGGPVPPP